MVDIPLVLDKIRPGAKWRRAGTYQELADTWEDEVQVLPTEQEILDAEAGTLTDQAARDDAPSLWACVEALIALNLDDPTVSGLADDIQAAKDVGMTFG